LENGISIKNLLLGVTGSVAVLSIPNYIRQFRQKGINVVVMMSYSSQKFITPYTMHLFSGNDVFIDSFDFSEEIMIPHLELTRKSDLFLIMPSTANIISKIANGICDDLISTTALASRVPVISIPNMNPDMWNSKANQKNIKLMKDLGYYVYDSPQINRDHIALVDIGKTKTKNAEVFAVIPTFEILLDFIEQIVWKYKNKEKSLQL
jgi:phosphopantothenoylcysteine decarboxylase/phosphopantothenate--cysteine ligase